VQRWEREKRLPIQRVPGSSGHSVFADAQDLDRWFASADAAAADPAAINTGTPAPPAEGDPTVPIRPHPSLLRLAALAGLAVVVALGAGLVRARSLHWPTTFRGAHSASGFPVISSVSAIQPRPDQAFAIRGRGFGVHCYYANEDVPFIAIRDITTDWAAGRIIPENWDEVTLNVARWTDTEIVVTGFAGSYGRNWWKLSPGDKIEVAVWNPQTHSGPAIYHLTVASPEVAKK
jgi:hypothetical protein